MNWHDVLFKPNLINTLCLLILLVAYRLTKRFKAREVTSVWAFLDHNIVEVGILALLMPRVAEHISEFIHSVVT